MGHVLCVDDDGPALMTVARALRTVAPIVSARSAAEALAALGPETAVVVSDQRMPGTSGTALLAEVGARDPTIGRLLLTAYVDADVLMHAINEGHVHRYLTKPWDPRELRAAVGQAVAATGAERERRRLSAEMTIAYARLREVDEMKTQVVTLAAHELRTPLHVLGGTLEALAALAGGQGAALLATARRNLAWLGRGVRAMTDLARLSRAAPLRREAFCLAALARRAVEEMRPLCSGRGLTLALDAPERLGVRGDADDLHHALMNLLLNALRFTPDGGRIDVAMTVADRTARLAVRDTGIGIAPAARARIGEPFFTVTPLAHHHSDPVAFGAGGIGLGLAVARAVMAAHGGRLTFESEEGQGATFVLELPRDGNGPSDPAGAPD
jgi:signal transduction histidine kinase